jgi:hypothetical protein
MSTIIPVINCRQGGNTVAQRHSFGHTSHMITATHNTDYTELLTVREAAEELQLAACTVASMVSRGTLSTVQTRFGRLITVQSVVEYRSQHRGKPGRKPRS